MTNATPTPMPMCPMASVCKGMMQKPFSGVWLILPGVVFICLGVLMVIEPRILLWVMAAGFVLFGAMMLMMVGFMRRMFRALPTHG
jgi:uncharacterized membrane protein HdeD (DUF308 family)